MKKINKKFIGHKAEIIGAIIGAFTLYFLGAPLLLLSPQSFPSNFNLMPFLFEAAIGLVFGFILGLIYKKNKIFFYGATIGAIVGLLAGMSTSVLVMTLWGAMPVFQILSWVFYPLSFTLLPIVYILVSIFGAGSDLLFAYFGIVPFLIFIGAIYGSIIAWVICYFETKKK